MEILFKALGLGLLNSIWQMALLYGLYKLLSILVCSSSAHRFKLGITLAFLGSLWFLVTIGLALTQSFYLLNETIAPSFTNNHFLYKWFMIVSGIGYALIFVYASLKHLWCFFQSRKSLEIIPTKVPVAWRVFIQQQADMLGIEKKVKVVCSSLVSPATFGWLKPVVLFPLSCITGMDARSLESLILHELAHIKRNDYLWHVILQIFETLLYPNPFMQLLVQDTKLESEKACDDLVLQFGYPAPLYAKALLQIAKNQQNQFLLISAKGSGHLIQRIQRMLTNKPNSKTSSKTITLAFLLSGFCLFISFMHQTGENNRLSKNIFKPGANIIAIENIEIPIRGAKDAWQQEVKTARMSIFENRLGKNDIIEPVRKNSAKVSNNKLAKQEVHEDETRNPLALGETIDQEEALFPNPVFINTDWANGVTPAFTEKVTDLIQTKTILTGLLDKLDEKGGLEDKEWDTVVRIVSLYHHLGALLQEEDDVDTYPMIHTEKKESEEILVVVYDEQTGLLTANLIDWERVNDVLGNRADETIEGRQQVILLHRKRDNRKAEIKL